MCDILVLYIICDLNPGQQCAGGKFELVLILVSFMSTSARELSTIDQVLDSHVSRYLIIFHVLKWAQRIDLVSGASIFIVGHIGQWSSRDGLVESI